MRVSASAITAVLIVCAACLPALRAQTNPLPERVAFQSADGRTELIGYLYRPLRAHHKAPAIVMMHGRRGAYSLRANGVYDASTLSQRHKAWGELLSEDGYFALMVDSFGPRGYPHGFGAHTYRDRPEELDEVTIRPLDAYGALAYLRTLPAVEADRIGLLGWSNGGSAALVAVSSDTPSVALPSPSAGFRAAVAFYPGCGLKGRFKEAAYRPYAPVHIYHGLADEETSPKRCAQLAERSRAGTGSDIGITLYPGATHGFDDPGEKRQSVEANAAATEQAMQAALRFFAKHLRAADR